MSYYGNTTPFVPFDPEGFADDFDPSLRFPTLELSGEQRLCLSVLLRALSDARGDVACLQNSRQQRQEMLRPGIMQEAQAWLADPTNTGDPHSAEYVCEVLGLSRIELQARSASGRIPNLTMLKCGARGTSFRVLWKRRRAA